MSSETAEPIAMLDAPDLGPTRPIGVLRRHAGRRTVVSFEYARSWVDWPESFAIDPFLPLGPGETFFAEGLLPGVLSDTGPDRWGRRLLERRELAAASADERPVRTLGEWDFLVGVSDETRMGAIRLRETPSGPFLEGSRGVPPMTRLRDLAFAAAEIERAPRGQVADPIVALLFAPGSSLGGARPKANVIGEDGALWIAKFPSRQDRWDVGRWEFLFTLLARDAGIAVSDCHSLQSTGAGTTFAARRFDRTGTDRRLYASALTMTGKRDGDDASYLDLALAIADHVDPAAIAQDLDQLFRRLMFNVMIGHRDDHLRNHGFLRMKTGWRLAPAFDLNPAPESMEHSLAIDERSHEPDLVAAIATAPFYRIEPDAALRIARDIADVVGEWRGRARDLELPVDEIELVASAIATAVPSGSS